MVSVATVPPMVNVPEDQSSPLRRRGDPSRYPCFRPRQWRSLYSCQQGNLQGCRPQTAVVHRLEITRAAAHTHERNVYRWAGQPEQRTR
jgi:hypothetical protein